MTTVSSVLISGIFGTGKSTVAADLADVVEGAGLPYAAIDLDWLTWTNATGDTRADEHAMMLVNLESVVRNYLCAGVTHFILARSIRDPQELHSLKRAFGLPLQSVELVLGYGEIESRIVADPTDGRRDDLERARSWLTNGLGSGFFDVVVSNDRPVRETTMDLVNLLGWLPRNH